MLRESINLYEFQADAKERMTERQQHLLALVMGAGKTITSVATIEDLIDSAAISKGALIVVPGSLKYQWQEAIRDFTYRHSLVIDGTPKKRKLLYSVAKNYWYVILSYDNVVGDWQTVRRLPFDCIVLDEATYIKSFTAQRSKRTKTLGRLAEYRYALTGQPIENRPEDLYSIMEFVDEDVLGEFDTFDRTFIVRDGNGKAITHRNLPVLNKRMADVMVRKTRADLKGQLPDVVEELIPLTFSRAEARLYNLVRDRLLIKMEELMGTYGKSFSLEAHYGHGEVSGAMAKAQGEVMSMMLALRHVCADARLLLESAHLYADRRVDEEGNVLPGHGSKFAWDLLQEGHLDVLPASTKAAALGSLMEQLLTEDAKTKIVAFSTFKGMLSGTQERTRRFATSVLYNGDMNARQKEAAKQQFKRDPRTRLFLSSDAGGYGVDLPMANYLISADLPWSTGKFEQRESRIIRLSSEFDFITLIAMIIRGSVEQRIWDSLQEKKGVAGAYLDGKYDSKGRFKMTLSSLTNFLLENTV